MGADEAGERIIIERVTDKFASRGGEIVLSSFDFGKLAGGKYVVEIIGFNVLGGGNVETDLVSPAAGDSEVRMPADSDWLGFGAHVFRGDCALDAVGSEVNADHEVGGGEPVTIEIAAINCSGDGGSIGTDLEIVGLASEDQAMD